MRKLITAMAFALVPLTAGAADKPDWAFPVTEKVQPPSRDDGKPKTAPGSNLSLTRAQIDDLFNPPDWRPDLHPPMPDVVAHGRPPNVRACGSCHLPTGNGHDESAYVAGLTPGYFTRQMLDFKSGARKGSGSMTAIGKDITDAEIKAAAEYFASVKPRPWVRVVEADAAPKTYVRLCRLCAQGRDRQGRGLGEDGRRWQDGRLRHLPWADPARPRRYSTAGWPHAQPHGPADVHDPER